MHTWYKLPFKVYPVHCCNAAILKHRPPRKTIGRTLLQSSSALRSLPYEYNELKLRFRRLQLLWIGRVYGWLARDSASADAREACTNFTFCARSNRRRKNRPMELGDSGHCSAFASTHTHNGLWWFCDFIITALHIHLDQIVIEPRAITISH